MLYADVAGEARREEHNGGREEGEMREKEVGQEPLRPGAGLYEVRQLSNEIQLQHE